MNPTSHAMDVEVSFTFEDGSVVEHLITVGPLSRSTVEIGPLIPGGNFFIQATTRDGVGIVAEAVMYSPGGTGWALCLPGASFTASTWYLAEGTTRGSIETWFPIMNISEDPTEVTFVFMFGDGSMQVHRVPLEAREYMNVRARHLVGGDRDFSTRVTAEDGTGIVVGRITYGGHVLSASWAHAAMGVVF